MKRPALSSFPERPSESIDLIETSDESQVDFRRDLKATLISTGIHLGVLLLLAFWVVPSIVGRERILLTSSFGDSEAVSLDTIDLSIDEAPATEQAAEDQALAVPIELMKLDLSLIDPISPTAVDSKPDGIESAPLPSVASDSIEGAVDTITETLESKLEKGDLLVVWLLDSSASLVDDRQRVASRLGPFYERIKERRSDNGHQLLSAVVSFGVRMKERIAPTEFGQSIVSTVEEMPIDRSGSEKVFDAVARCAEHYRKDRPAHQIVIVIWTDESGDDIAYLENTIESCRRNRVSVSVVGPSSVLGTDTGLHSYTDPKSQSVYQLPVKRGPETAMPERIELGYWYLTTMGGGRRGFRRGLPAWIGGQDLVGILCGFSPYALTRLARQTGGTYTIFDRPDDRAPFSPETMARYAPTYESVGTYQTIVGIHPLRRGIMKAVDELAGKKVDAPPTMFFIKKIGDRVFDFERYYYPPREFQAKLRASKVSLTRKASRYSNLVEKALAHLAQDDSERGLESQFQSEASPRWRAWYDLTRGRLLATSVRLEEYRLTVAAMTEPGFLKPTTNFVVLGASSEKRCTGKFLDQAEEAERLLRRCVREHAGTPWEVLAQRELDFALGVEVGERALTPTPGVPSPKQPNLPRF